MCLYGHANKARCCCWSGGFSWINSLKTPRIVSVTGYLSRGVQGESVTKSLLAQDLHLDILCKKPFQSKNFTFIWRDVFSLIGCRYSFSLFGPLIVWGLISSRWSQKALWMEELKNEEILHLEYFCLKDRENGVLEYWLFQTGLSLDWRLTLQVKF